MSRFATLGRWLHLFAEFISAMMLCVMFCAFIAQVTFRYVLNMPGGSASELTIVMWLWLVLWGAAFVLRESEEIRFDVIYTSANPKLRRVMTLVSSVVLLCLYGYSLPAVWDYVTFMKVQETSYLDIRYDYLYSIYILFVVAVLIRYGWIVVMTLKGREELPETRGEGMQ